MKIRCWPENGGNVMDNQTLERLTGKAKEIRGNIVEMIGAAKSGHPGGSLSAVEIMTYLY